MKKISLIIVFVLAYITCIENTNASCNYTRLSNLKKIASNVDISYTYKINDNKATFDITIANMTKDIYLYDSYNDKKYVQTGEFVINDFKDGTKYRFFIKSNDNDCKDEVLITKYITLPKYNQYYGDPICKGIENYTLCQKWGTFNVTSYKEYKEKIEKYKASLIKEEEKKVENKKQTLIDKVINFLYKYYVIILSTIIIVGSILIFYLSKKDKFNF